MGRLKKQFNRAGGKHTRTHMRKYYNNFKITCPAKPKTTTKLNMPNTFYSVKSTSNGKMIFTRTVHHSKTLNRDGNRIINLDLLA